MLQLFRKNEKTLKNVTRKKKDVAEMKKATF